jgi:hypothetical protein
MKSIFYILLIFTTFPLFGQTTYYVAPTGGNDGNAGTNIAAPWATWQKAFETAMAGDTVYFRGGIWYPSVPAYGNSINLINPRGGTGHNGEPGNRIHYFNYPGETPVLDCKNVVAPPPNPNGDGNRYIGALSMWDAHWLHFKGLTIRNVYQREENVHATAISGFPQSNMIFENITVHNIGGEGWYSENDVGYYEGENYGWDGSGFVPYDTTRYINCDTYQCGDTLSANIGNDPGNMGDGFKVINLSGHVTFDGCRAWGCSDDGFDMPGHGVTRFYNCWSFANGVDLTTGTIIDEYEGNGFKFGANSDALSYPVKILKNCIAAYNRETGFFVLEYFGYDKTKARIYNVTSYRNGNNITISYNEGWTDSESIFRNVITYGARRNDAGGRPYEVDAQTVYTISNSTFYYTMYGSLARWDWNSNYPISNNDFIETSFAQCMSQMTAPRKSDHSLPDITFLKLKETSPLKGAGIQIPIEDNSGTTLTFEGSAPDIGYMNTAEYTEPPVPTYGDKVGTLNGKLVISNGKIIIVK